jgi:probable rRNA maturation factor
MTTMNNPKPAAKLAPLAIEISDAQTHMPGLDRARLVAIAQAVLAAEAILAAEISVAIVNNTTIHEINRRHLDHDCPTDVISFVLSEPGDDCLSGELVVSAEMAVEMAERDGVSSFTELSLYMIHGLLHLCGHDDLTEAGAAGMRRREAEMLTLAGLSHPFSPVEAPSAVSLGEVVK